MNVPEDLKYTKEHEWAKIEGDVATVGITDFAQEQLTDIVFVELPASGAAAVAGKPIATVESVKAVSDIYAPVDGEIVEVNEALQDAPENVNKSPYGDGWMFRIKMSDPAQADAMMPPAKYRDFIAAQ